MQRTKQIAANLKNTGENTMSLKKSATRRLSLLAGSSLVAASLTGIGGLALMTPVTAAAQAVCTSPSAPPGNGTTAVTIPAGAHNPGITCTYAGVGSAVTTAGAVTVSTTDATPGIDDSGVNLSATGTSAVNWSSAAGTVTAGAQTNGPVIDATSQSGAISITTGAVTANVAGTTHGIRATSTGGGNITISRSAGNLNNNVAGGQAAIEAVTNGGNIAITSTGTTQGRLRGIFAQTSGAGSVNLTIDGGTLANQIDSVAAVEARAGTGGLRVLFSSGNTTGNLNPTRTAIIGASAGGADIDVLGRVTGRVDFSGVTAGGVTFDTSGTVGTWSAAGHSVFSDQNDAIVIAGTGTGQTTISSLEADSSIDLGAGADTFTVASRFDADAGFILLGAGTDVIDVSGLFDANGTSVDFGSENDVLNVSGVLVATDAAFDFGTGVDSINLTGVLAVNGMTLANLEAFNNSGAIYLGGTASATDGLADDVFRMSGGVFTGTDLGRVVMDVDFNGGVQAGCEMLTGAADCLDLRGATTAGQTILTLNSLGPAASLAGYDTVGITLVDVGGGTSAAGHFVLDPDTPGSGEDALYGQSITRPGLFAFVLRYDPLTQRHAIFGVPRREVLDYAVLGSAARSVWYMTASAITDRQTDLRAGTEGEVWLRASGEYDKRDMATSFEAGGGTLSVDNSYKQYSGSVIGGMDFVAGTSGGYDYVLGGQLGYVTSSFDLTDAESSGRMTGGTGGLYGGVWNKRFFLDGTFNANVLTLDYDQPGLVSKTNTYLNSVGAQFEGGIRQMLTERTYVEPLVSGAFVNTTFEEISLFGGEVRPDEAQSRRGAIGARIGADLTEGAVNVSYFVTGRAWHEWDGKSGAVINNPGADLVLTDDFSGSFGEAQAGVNLYNDDGTLSGFLNAGVKFKDGYDAVTAALGIRMRW